MKVKENGHLLDCWSPIECIKCYLAMKPIVRR